MEHPRRVPGRALSTLICVGLACLSDTLRPLAHVQALRAYSCDSSALDMLAVAPKPSVPMTPGIFFANAASADAPRPSPSCSLKRITQELVILSTQGMPGQASKRTTVTPHACSRPVSGLSLCGRTLRLHTCTPHSHPPQVALLRRGRNPGVAHKGYLVMPSGPVASDVWRDLLSGQRTRWARVVIEACSCGRKYRRGLHRPPYAASAEEGRVDAQQG